MGNQLALPLQFVYESEGFSLGDGIYDVDCLYKEMKCFYCSQTVGREYQTTNKFLSSILGKLLLDVTKVEVFDSSLDTSINLRGSQVPHSLDTPQHISSEGKKQKTTGLSGSRSHLISHMIIEETVNVDPDSGNLKIQQNLSDLGFEEEIRQLEEVLEGLEVDEKAYLLRMRANVKTVLKDYQKVFVETRKLEKRIVVAVNRINSLYDDIMLLNKQVLVETD